MSEQRLIAEFEKNALERVKVCLNEWQGNTYVDVRCWYRKNASDGDAYHPGSKGIRLHCELLSDLIAALKEAESALEG